LRHSIVGHGRRSKQAHDHDHDWIGVRRGRCKPCHQTFTFLPPFSLPYTHYSLIARSQALRRRFLEGCSLEAAAPSVKDPQRVADPSTLRRWFRSLDCSRPPFSLLRRTIHAVRKFLQAGEFSTTAHCRSAGRLSSPFSNATGPCGSEKIESSTILAWEDRGFSPTLDHGRKARP
jgi:hypothetical protein